MSVWNDYEQPVVRPTLQETLTADVAVIGGGMAGILTAHRLRECGATVVVLEADTVGGGQTAGTTAKLTVQHGMRYHRLIARRGVAAARLYATVHTRALTAIRRLIDEKEIACDLTEADAYLYSLTDREAMETEAKAQQDAGLSVSFTTDTELPIAVAGAVRCRGQACFHPLKFLQAVAAPLTIYEHTAVRRVDKNTVYTNNGQVVANHLVFACHYPFVNLPGFYFLRIHQERSYVLELQNVRAPGGMYWTPDPGGVSLRPYKEHVLLGGGGHRTGGDAEGRYAALRQTAKAWFPGNREMAHWSAQDIVTPDDLPYIGRFSRLRPQWYVATGFGKWGMTTSMVAAHLLAEEIAGTSLAEGSLFSPARFGWPDVWGVAKESGHALKGLTHLWSPSAAQDATALKPDEGGLALWKGKRAGVYHDEQDGWHTVAPRCPHLGCTLSWNADERTWDCPCHGSRFTPDGVRLNGPAQTDLPLY